MEVVGLKVDIVHYHIPRQLRDRKLFHDLLLLLLKFREIDFTEKNPISALSAEIYTLYLRRCLTRKDMCQANGCLILVNIGKIDI